MSYPHDSWSTSQHIRDKFMKVRSSVLNSAAGPQNRIPDLLESNHPADHPKFPSFPQIVSGCRSSPLVRVVAVAFDRTMGHSPPHTYIEWCKATKQFCCTDSRFEQLGQVVYSVLPV